MNEKKLNIYIFNCCVLNFCFLYIFLYQNLRFFFHFIKENYLKFCFKKALFLNSIYFYLQI